MLYSGENLREIIFPLGGIGTGSIGLCGNGRLTDWEIFNRPNKGSVNGYTHIAVRAEYPNGKVIVRVLAGNTVRDWMGKHSKYAYVGYGHGPDKCTLAGLPHFSSVKFESEFPFATLTFSDDGFPAEVRLKAFNPFIPLDSENSSLPIAFFDVSLTSRDLEIKYSVAFSLCGPYPVSRNKAFSKGNITGVFLKEASLDENSPEYSDMTLATIGIATAQESWYRGEWQDGITTFWKEFTENKFRSRNYETGSDHCTLAAEVLPGEHRVFVLSWNNPVRCNDWSPYPDENGKNATWKNYYATRFSDSLDSAVYALNNYDMLYSRSDAFRSAFFSSTLDPVLLEAASATLCVLKSPTVLRLEDGTFWGWEGVDEFAGLCEGTCTHVWSYAYALCFLFPDLERTIRNTEFGIDELPSGAMEFRTKLPLGRRAEKVYCCVDGQMASVFKAYREWMISGDTEWLKTHWGAIKRALGYAWSEENPHAWDRDKDGVLEGRQHHTLDVELFGPSSWLEGMYLAALSAAIKMARELGDREEKTYTELFERGKEFLNNELFNGKYYFQKTDVKDRSVTERFNCPEYWNEESGEIKYQIAGGSEIDQMLGQWHADLLGLGDIFDPERCKIALNSIMRYNFKSRIGDYANLWRNFAVDDESGTIICDYTDAISPAIPIPYNGECMTGFEYAFAGLLFSRGMVEEGLNVVRAIRDRYDGKKRNPFNEIEFGSNYARSMASFALLPIISGFKFDLPHGTIGFEPRIKGDLKAFWSVGTAWGTYSRKNGCAELEISEGRLELKSFVPGIKKEPEKVTVDGKPVTFIAENKSVRFIKPVTVYHMLTVE